MWSNYANHEIACGFKFTYTAIRDMKRLVCLDTYGKDISSADMPNTHRRAVLHTGLRYFLLWLFKHVLLFSYVFKIDSNSIIFVNVNTLSKSKRHSGCMKGREFLEILSDY